MRTVLCAALAILIATPALAGNARNTRIERMHAEIGICLSDRVSCEGSFIRVREGEWGMPFLRVTDGGGRNTISFDELEALYRNREQLRTVGITFISRSDRSWAAVNLAHQ